LVRVLAEKTRLKDLLVFGVETVPEVGVAFFFC
jgi:hypothetical protein